MINWICEYIIENQWNSILEFNIIYWWICEIGEIEFRGWILYICRCGYMNMVKLSLGIAHCILVNICVYEYVGLKLVGLRVASMSEI